MCREVECFGAQTEWQQHPRYRSHRPVSGLEGVQEHYDLWGKARSLGQTKMHTSSFLHLTMIFSQACGVLHEWHFFGYSLGKPGGYDAVVFFLAVAMVNSFTLSIDLDITDVRRLFRHPGQGQ